MGLAGEKKRVKLSHDPNNTKWTNDSSSFGLKMMTAQGWTPGQYLGARDASHAEFHTAANASHIRVAIKDDNLGLGAKIGTGVGHGECTGLDAFKNLLGRLNGKEEEEIAKEQKSRDDLRRAIYSERKWGAQRFVSGGFLIGDKIQVLIDAEAERIRKLALGESDASASDSDASSEEEEVAPMAKTNKSKKRKVEALDEAGPETVAVSVKKSKKKHRAEEATTEELTPLDEEKASRKPKKSKKERKTKPESEETDEEPALKKRKEEKKERRRKEKESPDDVEVEETEKEKRKREKKEKKEKKKAAEADSTGASLPTTEASTVVAAPSRVTTMMHGRHAVRSRYIAQKKLASMDAASLAQIFMIKSQ